MARRSVSISKVASIPLLCCVLIGGGIQSASAQEVREERPEKRVQLYVTGRLARPAGYGFLKPVPFQPFKYELPPGHPVDPNTKIVLPNRRVVTVREYIDSLNRIERGLAEVGHTMRAGAGHIIGPKYADDALFARQVATYHGSIAGKFTVLTNRLSLPAAVHNNLLGAVPRTPVTGARGYIPVNPGGDITKQPVQAKAGSSTVFGSNTSIAGLLNATDILKLLNGAGEYFNQGFSGNFGDSNFGANFGAHLKIDGSTSGPNTNAFSDRVSEMQATADMEAGANIMGNSFPLFQFNANCAGSDKTNTRSYDLGLYVGGVQIFHDHDSSNGPAVNWQDGFSVNWDAQSPTFVFPLFGPFEMKGFVGVKGGAGLTGSFRVRSFSVEGEITPYVTASAYGEVTAGVDLGVASADVGVDANLVLLDDHLTFKLDAGLAWDPKNHFSAVENCALTNDLNTMSGSFSLVAHVYGPWGFKLYDWSTELAGWPGESSHLEFVKPATQKLTWH